MKHLTALILILSLLSCTKESRNTLPELIDLNISASSATRSSFCFGDEEIKWTRGDRVAVFDGEKVREFVTEQSSGKAVFSGKVSSTATELSIVYPYSPDASFDNAADLIPETQWAVSDGFADDANVAVGHCSVTNPEVTLANVSGYVAITVPDLGFHKLSDIDFVAEGRTTSLVSTAESIPEGRYYFCVAPQTVSSFRVILHATDGTTATFGSDKPNEIRRNAVLDLGTIPSGLSWTPEGEKKFYELSVDFTNGAWPFDTAPGSEKYPESDKEYIPDGGGYAYGVTGSNYYATDFFAGPNAAIGLPAVPGHKLCRVILTSPAAYIAPFFTGNGGRRVSVVGTSSGTVHTVRIAAEENEKVFLRNYSLEVIKAMTLVYEQVAESRMVVTSVAGDGTFSFEGGSVDDYLTGVLNGRPFARPKDSPEWCNFYGPDNDTERMEIKIDFKTTCSLADFPTARQDSEVPEKEYSISGTPYTISLGCSGTSSRYLYRNKNHLHCNFLRAKFPVIENYKIEKVTFVQTIRNCAGAYLFGEGDNYKGLTSSNYTEGRIENQYCFIPDGVSGDTRINCMSDHILQIDSINIVYRKTK